MSEFQTLLVLSFIDYELALDAVDRRTSVVPLYMDHFDGFIVRSTGKAMGDHAIERGGKSHGFRLRL